MHVDRLSCVTCTALQGVGVSLADSSIAIDHIDSAGHTTLLPPFDIPGLKPFASGLRGVQSRGGKAMWPEMGSGFDEFNADASHPRLVYSTQINYPAADFFFFRQAGSTTREN
jgi:hypothetical protein